MSESSKESNQEYNKVIFAAMSKKAFYMREHIVKYILEKGYTPTCAFMMYSYFLLDTVNRRALISANNTLIERSDELWVFGEISDGVEKEIELAKVRNMPVKFFTINLPDCSFLEINECDALKE